MKQYQDNSFAQHNVAGYFMVGLCLFLLIAFWDMLIGALLIGGLVYVTVVFFVSNTPAKTCGGAMKKAGGVLVSIGVVFARALKDAGQGVYELIRDFWRSRSR